MKNMTQPSDQTTQNPPDVKDSWMIRSCVVYDDEYKDCTSIKGRLHQLFIFGSTLDCLPWRRDYDNCCRWKENQDVKSANVLVESEKDRRKVRLTPHYNNDVWQRRKSPPDNWNSPLPEYIQNEYENSYLNIKAKEMKGEIPPQPDPSNYCVLM